MGNLIFHFSNILRVICKPNSINKIACPSDCCSHLLTSELRVTPWGHGDQPAPGSAASRCSWKWPFLRVTHLLWNVNRFSQGSTFGSLGPSQVPGNHSAALAGWTGSGSGALGNEEGCSSPSHSPVPVFMGMSSWIQYDLSSFSLHQH